jgi:uncharacterized protein YecT (DUF1311 family)
MTRPSAFALIAAAIAATATPLGAHAAPADPFAYTLEVTPEEGPVDPAIEGRYTARFEACQKRAVTTLDNSNCFTAEFARQDAALNRAWKAARARLPAAARAPLLAAQRKWVAARDPFCKSQSDAFAGGTIAPVIYVSCRTELTIRRTLWLEGLR